MYFTTLLIQHILKGFKFQNLTTSKNKGTDQMLIQQYNILFYYHTNKLEFLSLTIIQFNFSIHGIY